MAACAWQPRTDGLDIFVRVTPRGGRDVVDGFAVLADGRSVLKVRVRVAPEDGAANRAVEKVIAAAIGVAASAVSVRSGATSRIKTVSVDGDADHLSERLRDLMQNG